MKRKDVTDDYDVKDGRITSPGKFEGEAIYAPYFYNEYLNGGAEDEGDRLAFDVTAEDRAEFPELKGVKRVFLQEDGNGFIYCETED